MDELKTAIWCAGNISDNLNYLAAKIETYEDISPSHFEQLRYTVGRFLHNVKNYDISIIPVLTSMDYAKNGDPDMIIEMYKEISQFNFLMFNALGIRVTTMKEK